MFALGLLVSLTRVVGAQDGAPSGWARAIEPHGGLDGAQASWLGAWSPLRPISDLAQGLLRAPHAVGLLAAPRPVAGAFFLTGAPAALARDIVPDSVGDRWGTISAGAASVSGSFHRPLDVTEAGVQHVGGQGWAPVGERGIAIGRFVLDQERADIAGYTARLHPYLSSPTVMTDSVQPPVSRTRARIEGALALRVGEFGVGFAAGVESWEHNTVDFPLRRSGRMALPAASFGVDRTLPWFDARIGGYARWHESAETHSLSARPLATVTYLLQGYDDPFNIPMNANDNDLYTRADRRASALGGTVDARIAGARLVVAHERGQRADDQTNAPFDRVRELERWRTDGSESRLQIARAFGSALHVMVVGAHESHDGSAVRSDLTGVAIVGTDSRSAIEVDARWTPPQGAWGVALRGGSVRNIHSREDFVAELESEIVTWTPFASAELVRTVGRGRVLIGSSVASRAPNSAIIPSLENRTDNYRRLVAPALAYSVAQATAVGGWVTVVVPWRSTEFFATMRADRTSPTTPAPELLQPGGEWSSWRVVVGMR